MGLAMQHPQAPLMEGNRGCRVDFMLFPMLVLHGPCNVLHQAFTSEYTHTEGAICCCLPGAVP